MLVFIIVTLVVSIAATVRFSPLTYNAQEGQTDPVEVCVQIFDLPQNGLECEVVVTLNTTDGAKTGMV